MMDPGSLSFLAPEDTVTNKSGEYSCYIDKDSYELG